MKQIRILMAALLVLTISIHQKALAQDKKPEMKEKIDKQERIMKKEVKEERKEMKEEVQEKKEEMNSIKEARKEEIKDIKQEHKDKMEGMKDHSDDDGAMHDNQGKKEKSKIKSNNGNAYGKNKEGLEGREFGQARAAEAREQIKNHEMDLKESEVRIVDSRNRLLTIVKRFEKSRAANEITEEEYALRKRRIAIAENKLLKAEQSLERNRRVVVEQNKRLSTIFDN